MIFHIPCLEFLLYFYMMAFPSAYLYFLKPCIPIKDNPLLKENLSIVIVYGVLMILALAGGMTGSFSLTSGEEGSIVWMLIPVALVMGLGNIGLEFMEASIPVYRKTGKFPKMRPTSLYIGKFQVLNFFSIIAAAALEELIFRQVLICGIFPELGFDFRVSVVLSAAMYAINHVYFGRFAVLQKLTSGLVYGLLFAVSGWNIGISILCHASQNLILYFYSLKKTEGRKTLYG